eukprot:4941822-Amphidinium_carterae.1
MIQLESFRDISNTSSILSRKGVRNSPQLSVKLCPKFRVVGGMSLTVTLTCVRKPACFLVDASKIAKNATQCAVSLVIA